MWKAFKILKSGVSFPMVVSLLSVSLGPGQVRMIEMFQGC